MKRPKPNPAQSTAYRVGGTAALAPLVPADGVLACPACDALLHPAPQVDLPVQCSACDDTGRCLLLLYPPQREARRTGRGGWEHELTPAFASMLRLRDLLRQVAEEEERLHAAGNLVPAEPIVRAILSASSYATASRGSGKDNERYLARMEAGWEHAFEAIASTTHYLNAPSGTAKRPTHTPQAPPTVPFPRPGARRNPPTHAPKRPIRAPKHKP